MIVLVLLVLLAAIASTAYSVVHSLRASRRERMENGLPVGRIALGSAALPVLVAVPSLLFGSLADMCIVTVAVMLVTAVALVGLGTVRTLRRQGRRKGLR